MDLNKTVKSAIKKYVGDIKSHDFPNKNEGTIVPDLICPRKKD